MRVYSTTNPEVMAKALAAWLDQPEDEERDVEAGRLQAAIERAEERYKGE